MCAASSWRSGVTRIVALDGSCTRGRAATRSFSLLASIRQERLPLPPSKRWPLFMHGCDRMEHVNFKSSLRFATVTCHPSGVQEIRVLGQERSQLTKHCRSANQEAYVGSPAAASHNSRNVHRRGDASCCNLNNKPSTNAIKKCSKNNK